MRVIRTIAAHENENPKDLPPLHDAVDTEALDAVFAPRGDGVPRRHGTVVFRYVGYRVTVSADGDIDAQRLGDPENGMA